MYDHTLHCGKKHFCCYCFQAFSTGEIPKRHIKDCFKINDIQEGKTKLICWYTGPTEPILNKNRKIILQNFGQPAFFQSIIFYFLKKIGNKT